MHNSGMLPFPALDAPELAEILRPAVEPVRLVSDADVHDITLADPAGYLAFLERELREIAVGRTMMILPPKMVFEDGPKKGDFRLMPCVTGTADRIVKSVKVVGTNLAQHEVPDQVTVGKAMLLHHEENYVTHLFDANVLSSIRTGACIALAARLLGKRPRHLVFFGAGRVGFYGAAFASTLSGIESMRFVDVEPNRAEAMARLLAGRGVGIRCMAGAPPRNTHADVVVLATTSISPFCRPPAWGASLIVSVGADTDYQFELDPSWPDKADIYVDTLDSARFGDLRRWLAEERVRKEDLRDMFEVMRSRPAMARPALFVSTGSALFDNLTMAYVAQRLSPSNHSSETKSSNL